MATLHPIGTFDAEVVNAVLGATQNGKPQVIAEFKTEHGNVRGYFFLTEKTVEHTAEKLLYMGFRGDSWSDINQAGFSMAGNKVSITIEHSEWEGKTSARVGFVNPVGYSPGLKGDDLAAANAKKFDAILHAVKGKMERGAKPVTAKSKPASDPKEPLPFDKDTPF